MQKGAGDRSPTTQPPKSKLLETGPNSCPTKATLKDGSRRLPRQVCPCSSSDLRVLPNSNLADQKHQHQKHLPPEV